MPIPFPFNFKSPDYRAVIEWRVERLARIREDAAKDPTAIPKLRAYYKENIAQFIIDWGMTYDPRNIDIGLSPIVPFILFPRQEECVQWIIERWKARESGVIPKSRDVGMSWLLLATDASLGMTHNNMAIGYGSRKEEYVDNSKDRKSLFWKLRFYLQYVPREFTGGFNEKEHAAHKRVIIPSTNSIFTGEAGDNIGRGDRTTKYNVDEAAHIERASLLDASLSATTNCRIDVSSANGMDNPFAEKVHSFPSHRVFWFRWQDDPRKDEAWYAKICANVDDPTVIAQEIDIDFNSSKDHQLIPSAWVLAAIDAHVKLNLQPQGMRYGALDVADQGKDKNAFAARYGFMLLGIDEWSGKDSDTFATADRAVDNCDKLGLKEFKFDADGIGAGIRGDVRVINERKERQGNAINAIPYKGSGEVVDADKPYITVMGEKDKLNRSNQDMFANRKAQEWWRLRMRFQKTFRWVTMGIVCQPSEIISIPSNMKGVQALQAELSQPTFNKNGSGQILVNKQPPGTRSPNKADAVVMVYSIDKQTKGTFD